MLKRPLGLVLFDGVTAMDVVGPLEVFAAANEFGAIEYQPFIVAPEVRLYRSESGIALQADTCFDDAPDFDTLVIPGGKGAREPAVMASYVPWLQAQHCRRMVSVCTGAFLMAATGVLNGRTATTHWRFEALFREHFPNVQLQKDALYIDHGDIATSAGISSGIDLALKLVEDDCGSNIAINVARQMVVHYRRSGNQAQFSEPLQYQARGGQEFSALIGWILQNLKGDLSVERLAEQANMSLRNFCRQFRQKLGEPPGRFVEQMRLDYARQLLLDKDWSIQKVADACGYNNVDVFRRAFERRFMLSPKLYRAGFSGADSELSNKGDLLRCDCP